MTRSLVALLALLLFGAGAGAQTRTDAEAALLQAQSDACRPFGATPSDLAVALQTRITKLEEADRTRRVVVEDIRGTAQVNPREAQVRVLHSGLGPKPAGVTDQAWMEQQAAAWAGAYYSVVLVPEGGVGHPVRTFVSPPRPGAVNRANSDPPNTLITFTFELPPATSWPMWLGQRWEVWVLPCVRLAGAESVPAGYGKSEPVHLFNARAGWLSGLLVAGLFLVVAGIGTAYVNPWQYEAGPQQSPPPLGWWARFNPIVLCQDTLGYASLARFQIFLFSAVLLGLFAYAFAMTGEPPGISTSVLTLLGITLTGSTVGAAVAKPSVTQAEHRLWLIGTGVLKKERRIPRFADLFTADGAVDITRLQALGFTCFAAVALVYNGHVDLANYELPSQLNTLIGISQATYVAGKAITPEALTRLNAEVTAVIESEKAALLDKTKTDDFDRKKAGIRVALLDVYGAGIDADRLAKLVPGDRI